MKSQIHQPFPPLHMVKIRSERFSILLNERSLTPSLAEILGEAARKICFSRRVSDLQTRWCGRRTRCQWERGRPGIDRWILESPWASVRIRS